jgi:hypothetical protein
MARRGPYQWGARVIILGDPTLLTGSLQPAERPDIHRIYASHEPFIRAASSCVLPGWCAGLRQ